MGVERGGEQSSVLHPGKGGAGAAAVGASGGEIQGEKGEEEAEDWNKDEGNVAIGQKQIVLQVVGNPSPHPIPTSHVCHAEAIDDRENYGCPHVE